MAKAGAVYRALPSSAEHACIRGEGEMADLVRAYDWGSTELGSIDTWSESLVAVVNVMLNSPHPITLHLGEGMIEIHNDAYAPVLGKHHAQALGRSTRDLWPEVWPLIGSQFEEVLSEGIVVKVEAFQLPLQRGDRLVEHFWDYCLSPIYEGDQVIGIFNLSSDVTDAVNSMRALSETDDKLRLALSAVEGVYLWDYDLEHDLVFPGSGFASFFGCSLPTAGSALPLEEFLSKLDRDDAQRAREALHATYETGRPYFLEHRVYGPDGRVHWVASRARCVLGSDGRVERLRGVTVDITRQKKSGPALVEDASRGSASRGRQVAFDPVDEAWLPTQSDAERIVAAERIFGAVVVSFETGRSLLFPASVLLAASKHAIDLTDVRWSVMPWGRTTGL